MTPAVTVGSALEKRYPKGLPMAMAHSPITSPSVVPRGATGRAAPSIWSTATSVVASLPTTAASKSLPSGSVTRMRSAPRTTCSFVRIVPEGAMTKPEPKPVVGRGL